MFYFSLARFVLNENSHRGFTWGYVSRKFAISAFAIYLVIQFYSVSPPALVPRFSSAPVPPCIPIQ